MSISQSFGFSTDSALRSASAGDLMLDSLSTESSGIHYAPLSPLPFPLPPLPPLTVPLELQSLLDRTHSAAQTLLQLKVPIASASSLSTSSHSSIGSSNIDSKAWRVKQEHKDSSSTFPDDWLSPVESWCVYTEQTETFRRQNAQGGIDMMLSRIHTIQDAKECLNRIDAIIQEGLQESRYVDHWLYRYDLTTGWRYPNVNLIFGTKGYLGWSMEELRQLQHHVIAKRQTLHRRQNDSAAISMS